MSPPLVRCFWAVRPPDECLAQVDELVRLLKRPLASLGLQVAWTSPESYHLTLKFLGDVAEAEVGAMVAKVQSRLGSSRRAVPALALTGLGVFPEPLRPRILYVDAFTAADLGGDPAAASAPSTELQGLQSFLEDELAPLGYARAEHPYHPHLTIGRVRTGADAIAAELPAIVQRYAAHRHGPAFRAETLILYESEQAPAGPRYTPIARLPLAAAP